MEQVMSRKEELASIYWDFYKEVYNVRPRWINFEACSEEELTEMLNRLDEQAKAVFAQREVEEQAAIKSFEDGVTRTIAAGAADRATAIKWLMDAELSINGDVEYFEYLNALPYGYIKKSTV